MSKNLLIFLAIITAGVAGFYYFSAGTKDVPAQSALSDAGSLARTEQVVFSINARKWQFTPDAIRVKKGQKVKININNIDVPHGINLPEFDAAGDNSIEFIADKSGNFPFFCKIYCGEGHAAMTGKIIVTD